MDLDLRTLALTVALIDVLQVIAIFIQYRLNKSYRGIGLWLLGITMIAGGFITLLLRDQPSIAQISIIISNSLIIPGMILLYFGVNQFLDMKKDPRAAISLFLVYIVAIIYFTYAVDDFSARTAIQSAVIAIVSFFIVKTLYSNKPRIIDSSITFLTAVFLAQGLFFSFRSGLEIVSPDSNIFTPTLNQTVMFLVIFILSFLYTFGFIIMINQRMNSELREAKEHFELIFNTSPDAAFITRPEDGQVLSVNHTFTDMTGYTSDEIIGKTALVLWKDLEDRKKVVDQIREKGYCDNYEAEFLRKDGSQLTGVLSTKTFLIRGVPYIINVTRDITERKQAEIAVKLANKKLNLLSNITRHDIMNQLMVLTGNLSLLEGRQSDQSSNERLRKAEDAAERISTMIEFTKAYEDIGVHAPVWQDVRTIVASSAEDVPLEAVKVVNDVPVGMQVFADPLIVKVFHNLMHNAIRHGGHITTIHFSMEERGGAHTIVCEDDGVGIQADMKDELFTRGFGKDHGLGLFLSREILSITGIAIAEAGEPGHGAKFVMTVPPGGLRTT